MKIARVYTIGFLVCALGVLGCGGTQSSSSIAPPNPGPAPNTTPKESSLAAKPAPYAVAATFLDALQAGDNEATKGLMTKSHVDRTKVQFELASTLLREHPVTVEKWAVAENSTEQTWSNNTTQWRIKGTITLRTGRSGEFSLLLEKQMDTGLWRVEAFVFR